MKSSSFFIIDYLHSLNAFVLISFFAALVGTLSTVILFFILKKLKKNNLLKAVPTLSKIFFILWIFNVLSNAFLIYQVSSNKTLAYINNRPAIDIKPGTVLAGKDKYVKPEDFTVKVKSGDINDANNTVEMDIWDFASDDGGEVQVFYFDTPITKPFKLSHSVQKIKVPRGNFVQIRGIKDGKNGTSYAVYFADSKETFLNSAPAGCTNYYILSQS